ncbi:glycosyltransferase family 64 protein [Cystobasidium minutum MCA 4210]|uniref:glycosyltransferase family 64 protein n=1 Tax=Cystobasidium minutum MCA 4210 TaxID=1397322 RepID=UPI0034CD551C|eukprot:jgi/Rhomi1/210505/estExt_Genemark1.C_4_t10043
MPGATSGPSLRLWLLAACGVATLLFFIGQIDHSGSSHVPGMGIAMYSSAEWQSALQQSLNAVRHPFVAASSKEALIQDKYSIIISTYSRIEHLHHFLGRTANGSLPNLDAVFIAWGLGAVDPPEWLDLQKYKVPVYLERARVNSLTERFRKPANMRTEAGLWIDDDLQFHPDDIELGFRTYRQFGSSRHQITGYSGRLVSPSTKKEGTWIYDNHAALYSMILTNSAWMDQTMLDWFWSSDQRIQDSIVYVDKHMNCEDILMNFVVSSRNGNLPSILVDALDVRQLKTSGISDKPGHYEERSKCVDAFAEIWGMPLRDSDLRIGPATREDHRHSIPLDPPFNGNFIPWAKDKDFVAPADI